ncbi:DUF4241 domain-containing protein [Amycolatopsis thermoflava]|uniref:DUF4241 domain-containing protein n=1 Tax=Amycolatopsis thermoflava TaxID=84480 RepID=UPI003D707936
MLRRRRRPRRDGGHPPGVGQGHLRRAQRRLGGAGGRSGLGRHARRVPSGWGDGSYPTWIGRTAGGAIACFVADFLVLRDAEPAPAAAVQ